MWQWPQLADLLKKGLRTVAFHQVGVPYAKPTRLLLCTSLDMPDFVYEGLPSYDDQGYYKGPLPSAQGFAKMFQRQAKGAFKTTGSEQWPVAMCQWLSAMLLSSCLLPAKDAVGEGGAAAPDDKLQDSFPINAPEGPRVLGGYHDGGGAICSPGRWAHHARSYADGSSWDWLRDSMLKLVIAKVGSEEQLEKEAFRMAAGGEQGCSLASDRELQSQLRQLWKEAGGPGSVG